MGQNLMFMFNDKPISTAKLPQKSSVSAPIYIKILAKTVEEDTASEDVSSLLSKFWSFTFTKPVEPATRKMNYINALCCCNDESVLTQSLVQSVIEQHSLLNGETNETTNNTGSTTAPCAKTNTTTSTANTYTEKQEQEEAEKTNNTTNKIKTNKSSEQFNTVLEFLTGNQLVTVAVKTQTDLDNKEVR